LHDVIALEVGVIETWSMNLQSANGGDQSMLFPVAQNFKPRAKFIRGFDLPGPHEDIPLME
jgi:hypothetical protein